VYRIVRIVGLDCGQQKIITAGSAGGVPWKR
jgi:hypothetical protein